MAHVLETESSEAGRPRQAQVRAVAEAGLVVADLYAVSALAPVHFRPAAAPGASAPVSSAPLTTWAADLIARHIPASPAPAAVLHLDENAPALLRIGGRSAHAYRVRVRPAPGADWVFEDLSVVSRAAGDVSAHGMAVLDRDGGDVLRITGALRRAESAPPVWRGAVLAPFGIDYE